MSTAARRVAYITLGHLFWRDVATGAPALPLWPDPAYRLIFPQGRKALSDMAIARGGGHARSDGAGPLPAARYQRMPVLIADERA